MSYARLIRAILRAIVSAYKVWQMDEVVRSGKELYSCAGCGMALSEPCEHWLSMERSGDSTEGKV